MLDLTARLGSEARPAARAIRSAPAHGARGRAPIVAGVAVALLPFTSGIAAPGDPVPPAGGSSAEAVAAPSGIAAPGTAPTCALFSPSSAQVKSATCMSCHPNSKMHPIDVHYATRASGAPHSYAPVEEVVRVGVLLPDGQIQCVTCHDGRSPWKHRIALPPGAAASPALRNLTKEDMESSERAPAAPGLVQPGSEVSSKPLCLACHRY